MFTRDGALAVSMVQEGLMRQVTACAGRGRLTAPAGAGAYRSAMGT